MKKYKIILLISRFLLLLVFSCDKTPVGYNELERDVSNPVFTEFRPNARFSYSKYVPLGTADYLVLGRNSEYESRVLIQFPLQDSALAEVDSVKLTLYPKHYQQISFSIHPIVPAPAGEWRENYATWIKMDEGIPWQTDGGDFLQTQLVPTTTLTADSCIMRFNLNKLDTLVNHSYGIILIPEPSVQGFATINSKAISSKAPKMVMYYGNTPKVFTPSQDCHIVDTTNLGISLLDLMLGSGFAFRTLLKFNVDTIPDNVTIAYAEIILPVQSCYSISDTFQIGIWKLLDPTFNELTKYADNISAKTNYITSRDTIIFDLRKLLQHWIAKPDSNFGILVSCYPENYEISRIKLKTNIYLKVGYILPPQGRF